jgi:hypothetical protein
MNEKPCANCQEWDCPGHQDCADYMEWAIAWLDGALDKMERDNE